MSDLGILVPPFSTERQPIGNPFPGLRPFRSGEETLFFGREAHIDRMVDVLSASGLLAVVGSSGSGKSSLVTCGLVPSLHRGLMASQPGGWRVAICSPGNQPVRALAHALAKTLPTSLEFSPEAQIEATLRASKRGLLQAWQESGVRFSGQPNLLVVIDQFEELFRYHGLRDAAGNASASEAVAFVNLLLEVAAHRELPLAVVITMRSDFLGECAQFHGLPESINRGLFLVPRMTRDERRAAVRGPLNMCGAQIDQVLLNRLVNEVGDNPDQLSILQHALNRTWAVWQAEGGMGLIATQHYDAIGTMEQALDRHADEVLAMLVAPAQAALAEAIFRAITDRGTDARGIRRPTRLDTLQSITGADASALAAVMQPFRDPSCAFLMPPNGVTLEGATPVDISHESLMRVWTRLRHWTEAEAQSARICRRLSESAALYAKGDTNLLGPPELQVALAWRDREQPNRAWAERYGMDFDATMAFLDTSRVAFETNQVAEQARRDAEAAAKAERERADLQAQAEADKRVTLKHVNRKWMRWMVPLGLMAIVWLVGLVFAIRAETAVAEAKAVQAAAQMELAIEQARLADSARKQLEAEQTPVVQTRKGAPTAAATDKATMYLQFADPGQRALVERLRVHLAQSGYKVPPGEQVAAVPSRNELRYFRPDSADAARSLVAELHGWEVADVQTRYVAGYPEVAQRQQFELWLARPTTELRGLVQDLDSPDKNRRLAAGQELQNRWQASPDAISKVLGLLEPGQIEQLSDNGRINALYYMTRTALTAWTPALAQRGRSALARINEREKTGKAVGAQTRAEMVRLAALLDGVEASLRQKN